MILSMPTSTSWTRGAIAAAIVASAALGSTPAAAADRYFDGRRWVDVERAGVREL
jgi:hypothetical protein